MKKKLKIKVCGMREKENLDELYKLDPDFIGFIFYKKSKRFVGEAFDSSYLSLIPCTIKKVGVFVNADIDYLLKKVNEYTLDLVQLHGIESPEYCKKIQELNIPVIKTFGVDIYFDFNVLSIYYPVVNYFLFDTKSKNYGGTGLKFDWKIFEKIKINRPFFLSGGIDIEDVSSITDLLLKNDLFAVDINSRFEIKPALKDIAKVKKFITHIRTCK